LSFEMDREALKPLIEALIFAADRPISIEKLMNILEGEGREGVRASITELMKEYNETNRGIVISEVAGGYQMRTRPEFVQWLKKLFNFRFSRLSKAAMEALAIVAYKQPLTRVELEDIRGVDSGGVLRTLLEKSLIKVIGRKDLPGRPSVYGTTREFLEAFDLKNLSYLPNLRDIEESESDAVREATEDYRQSRDNLEEEGGGADPAGQSNGEQGCGDPTGSKDRS
jgi:segregation and condensation protein B